MLHWLCRWPVSASIGLYGLVSVSMKAQIKEVGIRKVLGCSSAGIILLFLQRYTWPLLVANLIAWPVAIYFVQRWIERFPYQLETFWLIPVCLFTGILVLAITWLAVGLLTWQAASNKPVTALRYE